MKKRASQTRKVLDVLQIDFLSGCPRPMQEGATALLMKRYDPDPEKVEKDSEGRLWKGDTPGILTSAENGHTHIVWLYGSAGETTMQRDNDPDDSSHHDHPWVLSANGSVEIGANLDHTHTVEAADVTIALVAAMNKAHPTTGKLPVRKEIDMPDDKTLKALEKRMEQAEARAEKAEERADLHVILGGLTSTQKAHFDTLTEDAKPIFATKSHELRDAEIDEIRKAHESADPVLYKTAKGVEVRKSHGDVVLALAKDADEDRTRAEKAENALSGERLTKAAAKLGALPGESKTTEALLKAVETIPEGPERDAVMAQIQAGNTAIEKAFTRLGSNPNEDPEDGGAGTLAKLVKAEMESSKVNEAHATVAVLKTAAGAEAYENSQKH